MGELRLHERQRCIDTYQQNGSLQEHFPLRLRNGVSVPTPSGVCSECETVIDPSMVHGRVSWPIADVAVIDATGFCQRCQRMTQLYLRVRPSGNTYRAEAPRMSGSGWVYVEPPAPTVWRRLRLWLVNRVAR